MYEYRCQVLRVVDGDTFVVRVDLGFDKIMIEKVIRLLGVDTPEVTGQTKEVGLSVKSMVNNWVGAGQGEWPFIVRTTKKDSFGRWLAYLYDATTGDELNAILTALGYTYA